ncbi:hypothetical protein J9253_17425 [Thiothrix litoralis]|uniref:HTH HARE-type domain-containing protein n=1 Tax=Thiothrix litoralis TaxID=2891210 RepID=A0ABX7WRI2_9GAMM|nr:hypothetical protein [Thiothrix litoralis]QTR45751.1 hypothetical protein J9253_17425 [Thiothrix litoralis]
MYLKEEWHVRKIILEAALDVLSDGQNHTARQIISQLEKKNINAPKKLVNSVLFSEGRRYVTYNKSSFFYQLRSVDESEIEKNIDIIKNIPIETRENSCNAIKAKYIGKNDEFIFTSKKSTSPAFFDIFSKGRTIEVSLNENHPLFFDLNELLFFSMENKDHSSNLMARKVIDLMVASWAKYESEQPEGARKNKAEEARIDWGKHARDILFSELTQDIE